MALRLLQLLDRDGVPMLAAKVGDGDARRVGKFGTAVALAQFAIDGGLSLAQAIEAELDGESVDLAAAEREARLLPAINDEDVARIRITGTGLTHLGSAESRDRMHRAAAAGTITDSMRMFLMGVEGGKPQGGSPGVQPEWFYKGDGSCIVGPGADLVSPDFALDGSEEPEIAGVYLIDADGNPRRLGFVLANEFSDHVTERANYLWLAHSKLRSAALGAEILTGELPEHIRGTSRIVRDGQTIWERPFLSGEANMSHSVANLEHHHFKYDLCRRPGDIHVHCFGTATLSFADEVATRAGDLFEIEADCFELPLRNRLATAAPARFEVIAL